MRNIHWILFLFLLSPVVVLAQDGKGVFNFLRFPTSSRANALGGHTVALVEPDPSLIFHNPALLGGEMDQMINVNYMKYFGDIHIGSAVFTKASGERGAWGVGATFINYGTIKEVTVDHVFLGEVSMKDISLNGFYAYDLSDRWRGGLSLKFLYSSLADYTSIGLGVDAGLSYYESEKNFSFGFTLKNIGAQLTAYDEEREKMPWDIQMGITKKMEHAPIRFSLTAMYLNRWKFDYIDDNNRPKEIEENFSKRLFKHFIIGVDLVPSDNFWIGVGFNPKTNMDMKLAEGGNGMGGFSIGAGLRVSKFDVSASVARYHPSALSLMVGISTSLHDFKP
ncbi:type IX secretion system protein PorQ [Parabacteroides sp. Marseille-P3160]|uniref:type IX secretion system protein PorQ n=1 Tax=Parabacteroides sp. Marseille-P3160 TaxID=1917887 RepID=UPI0009BB3C5C|nr:type IX secretion system protein PorQ [Parabacteroides sp. Marseille-P3160]